MPEVFLKFIASSVAEWLRHPPVETLVVTGSDPGLADNLFLHFFLTKMNTVQWIINSTFHWLGQSNTYNYFTKLCKLEIWNKYGQENEWLIGANVLKQLLCRAPLNYLLLQRIGNFNDDLFASILQVNPLLSLRNIVIDYCHNVTERIIWMLLEQPNNLEVWILIKESILDILFSSNHNIHKSWFGHCFWPSDP